ncbi:four helix bundle protein [Hyphobacterium sp. CCMP332]|nr:four helix bundle protein [Hyphobacterium sp. CCMP332]
MKGNNLILDKSFELAIEIIKAYKFLSESKKEYVLSKQLLRCGTSVGANVEESVGAQSKKDFLNKISISYKEARETKYWIRLLLVSEYLNAKGAENLLIRIEEVLKILGSIQKTLKASLNIQN